MTISSKIITPRAGNISVSRQTNLGVADYDLDQLYSPDNAYAQSCVLDLASPKYSPNKTYIFDKSRYGNHGTITGATRVRLPSGLWVLNFDGDDSVSIASSIQPLAAQGTIEIWAYMANWADNTQRVIFDTTDVGGINRLLIRKQTNNTPLFYGGASGELSIEGASALSGSGWKFWVATYATNNCAFRINAVSIGTDNVVTVPTFTTGLVKLGRTADGPAAFFNGQQALHRINNAVLSTAVTDGHFNQERSYFGI